MNALTQVVVSVFGPARLPRAVIGGVLTAALVAVFALSVLVEVSNATGPAANSTAPVESVQAATAASAAGQPLAF